MRLLHQRATPELPTVSAGRRPPGRSRCETAGLTGPPLSAGRISLRCEQQPLPDPPLGPRRRPRQPPPRPVCPVGARGPGSAAGCSASPGSVGAWMPSGRHPVSSCAMPRGDTPADRPEHDALTLQFSGDAGSATGGGLSGTPDAQSVRRMDPSRTLWRMTVPTALAVQMTTGEPSDDPSQDLA